MICRNYNLNFLHYKHFNMSKILIIDDERSIRNSLKDILEYEKYTVDEAQDGQDGLKKLKSGDFDLVLGNRYKVIHCIFKMDFMGWTRI